MQPIINTTAGLLLTYFLVAFFVGGIQGARRDIGQPILQVLVYAASCGISGLVVSLLYLWKFGAGDPYLPLLFVVLAAWAGPTVIDKVLAIVVSRFQSQLPIPPEPPAPPSGLPPSGPAAGPKKEMP